MVAKTSIHNENLTRPNDYTVRFAIPPRKRTAMLCLAVVLAAFVALGDIFVAINWFNGTLSVRSNPNMTLGIVLIGSILAFLAFFKLGMLAANNYFEVDLNNRRYTLRQVGPTPWRGSPLDSFKIATKTALISGSLDYDADGVALIATNGSQSAIYSVVIAWKSATHPAVRLAITHDKGKANVMLAEYSELLAMPQIGELK